MYYRHKVLLALIEVAGGRLRKTDCQKLMLLACSALGKNHYDFYPHHYGNFSSLLYYDKSRLTDLGYFKQTEDFQLSNKDSHLKKLKLQDQKYLLNFASEFAHLRGDELLRYIYLKYPEYTRRSNILEKILNPEEVERTKTWWNTDETSTIFTLGYEGLSIDAYLDKLIVNNVKVLVDVRHNPQSMKYGFSKTTFRKHLESGGIQYFHLPDLGIPSERRQNLKSLSDYKVLFSYYQDEILPEQQNSLNQLKNIIRKHSRVALTCFEADYHMCHRHKITEFLVLERDIKVPVFHL